MMIIERIGLALFAPGGLLKVRSLLAFAVVGAVIYLAVHGKIPADDMKTLGELVIGFYFITRAAEKANGS